MKNALVTGASGGIGRAVAKELARRGWRVALHYHANEAAAKSLEEAICREGGFARAYPADLTQEAQVEALFGAVERDLGFVEGLVNSAGVAWKGLFTDMTLADWRWVVDGDLTSVFLCCRRALPAMIREKRGSIVNVSSMWGEVGASCEAAYSAAKAGVIGLTKALAKEEGPSGIRVNCLSPGVIDTPMNGDLTEADLAPGRCWASAAAWWCNRPGLGRERGTLPPGGSLSASRRGVRGRGRALPEETGAGRRID